MDTLMTIRPLQGSDISALYRMAEASGFPYPNLETAKLEAVLVVVDDEGQPIMAAAAERLVQTYLWCKGGDPHVQVAALRLLHQSMGDILKTKGYSGAEAFIPPSVAQRFGRRLEKTFGWRKNWPSWTRGI